MKVNDRALSGPIVTLTQPQATAESLSFLRGQPYLRCLDEIKQDVTVPDNADIVDLKKCSGIVGVENLIGQTKLPMIISTSL
jgi:hypothetical protein